MKWGDHNHSDRGLGNALPLVSQLSCCDKRIVHCLTIKTTPITEGKPLQRFAGIIHFVENFGHFTVS